MASELRGLTALVIDDEKSICESIAGVLTDEGWNSVSALNGRDGLRRFQAEPPDLVLLDIWMSGMDGIETLQRLKEVRRDIPVVIMSGHGSIETAVRATKLGAFDYLEKPLSIDKIIPLLDHAAEHRRKKEKADLGGSAKHELMGGCPEIEAVRQRINLVASKNAWILITGENGTGKEVVAQQIHHSSTRAKHPFVAINCAAIPEELIESELFGFEKGAFTNAISRKKGKFEVANKGTLFLDEIGDMSPKTQAKILRILQEQTFERIGGRESINVDVRVIAATNKKIEDEIKNGNFRLDLYYRLNVIPFHLPPLRERGGDIALLANYFIKKFSDGMGLALSLSSDALVALNNYSWPGNVRELRNVVERICIMASGDVIGEKDLPENIRICEGDTSAANTLSDESLTLKEAKSDFEKLFILKKLEQCEWNVSRTAESIGIERSNLHRKLKVYEIDPKQLKDH